MVNDFPEGNLLVQDISYHLPKASTDQSWSGAPNVNIREISVRKTIWYLEFSEHLL